MTPKQQKKLQKELSVAHFDHQKGLGTHAFFKVGDRAVSEDLVQDTFLKTWKYLVKGGKVHTMKAFLYHILNHLIVDEYRKRKTTSLDLLLEKGFEPLSVSFEDPVAIFDAKASLLLIHKLPLKYQKIMRMRYVQDLSLKEIALLTGQSRNTIAVQAHRGLIKLKELYKIA
ncbi:sigma-70 family RNA polymerase sigma factor [Patescibacteria group bacterium]|nr:sigma-70 family RNA polymerase sigma factor [Patescibacteria group bacterium]